MTTYGTIQAPPPPPPLSSNLHYISRAKERIGSGLATRRPWKQVAAPLGLPNGFADTLARIAINLPYFQANYAIAILSVLFLSLLWHPASLIVFVVTMAAWLFLYFLRDDPIVMFGREIHDRVVLVVLSVVTIGLLFLTDATVNIVAGVAVGVAVVLVHAVLRRTDDLLLMDEEEGGGGGGGGARMVMKETASSSFSSS